MKELVRRSQTIEEWLDKDVTPLKKLGDKYMYEMGFWREEFRPSVLDSDVMFSPADGIIIGQKIVRGPYNAICQIKGVDYSLEDAMGGEYFKSKDRVMVIEIFLTQYHIHYIRCPYSGYISQIDELDSIKTYNKPMLDFEKGLLENIIDLNRADYMFYNSRTLTTFTSPKLKSKYYLLQIADYDVSNLVSYHKEKTHVHQHTTIGQMRFGSQATLIVPIPRGKDYFFAEEIGAVVKGIQTPLFYLK